MIGGFTALVRKVGVAGDASHIMGFQLLALAFTLISSVLVARALGPADKGMFDLYTLLLSLLVEFGLLGLPAGLLHAAMSRKVPLGRVHGTGLALVLAVSAMVALVLLVFGHRLLRWFPELPAWVLTPLVLAIPAGFYMAVWNNLLIAQDRAVLLQRFSALFGAVNVAVVIALFNMDLLSVRNYLLASVALSLAIALFSFIYLRRKDAAMAFDKLVATDSLRFGLPVFMGGVANFLHFKVDQLMISRWIGLEGVGLYALSVRWAEMLFMLDAAIVTAALYRIGSKQPSESRAYATDVMWVQLGVGLAASVVLALFVFFGFEFIYGEAYGPAITPLLLLLPGVLAWSALKPLANYLTYTCGRAGLVGWFSVVGLLCNVLLNYLLIRWSGLGIEGAAVASSLSYMTVAGLVGLVVFRQRGMGNVSH